MKTTRIYSLELPLELYHQLEELSRKEDRPRSTIIRRILKQYIETHYANL